MTIDPKLLADPSRWTVRILPLPKRQSASTATGLCGGEAVGESFGAGYRETPVRWTIQPEFLTFGEQKRLSVRKAHGSDISGFWRKSSGDWGGAVGWRRGQDGTLATIDLHDKNLFEWTIAMGTGGGAFCGFGQPKAKKGAKVVDQAICWLPDGTPLVLPVPESENIMNTEALAEGTDGKSVVGRIGWTGRQQAALWKIGDNGFVLLGNGKSVSEAYGVRDGEQVGVLSNGKASRAALWRGSAESFVDLTPVKYQTAVALDCAVGLQVGFATQKELTRGGSASMASQGALWTGSAKSFVDLQAFVPPPWNASSASAIEVDEKRILIAGEVTQYAVTDELTARESHYQAGKRAAIWEFNLA